MMRQIFRRRQTFTALCLIIAMLCGLCGCGVEFNIGLPGINGDEADGDTDAHINAEQEYHPYIKKAERVGITYFTDAESASIDSAYWLDDERMMVFCVQGDDTGLSPTGYVTCTYIYNILTHEVEALPSDPERDSDWQAASVTLLDTGDIFVSGFNGFYLLDGKTYEIKHSRGFDSVFYGGCDISKDGGMIVYSNGDGLFSCKPEDEEKTLLVGSGYDDGELSQPVGPVWLDDGRILYSLLSYDNTSGSGIVSSDGEIELVYEEEGIWLAPISGGRFYYTVTGESNIIDFGIFDPVTQTKTPYPDIREDCSALAVSSDGRYAAVVMEMDTGASVDFQIVALSGKKVYFDINMPYGAMERYSLHFSPSGDSLVFLDSQSGDGVCSAFYILPVTPE